MTHFEKEINAVAVTVAHLGNDLTIGDIITALDKQFTVMAVNRHSAGAVRNDNEFAIAAHVFTDVEHATGGSSANTRRNSRSNPRLCSAETVSIG